MEARGTGFLLVQLAAHAARRFAERLAPLDLEPRHAGLLLALATREGRSQQELGEAVQVPPSRMVALVDDLDRRGLIERRRSDADRRAYALHLTAAGSDLVNRLRRVSAEHEAELLAGLDPGQRTQLADLLRHLAADWHVSASALPRTRGRS